MKKVAIILAGSGAMDGSEIRESTLAMLALCRSDVAYDIFAPDIPQSEVCNHLKREKIEQAEPRNCMIEAARIARGKISPLTELHAQCYDALVIPGGFGTAKNLFSFAFDDLDFTVLPQYERVVREFHAQSKPIGAMCIAPVALAKIFEGTSVVLTLGEQSNLGDRLTAKFGVKIQPSSRREAVVDERNRIVTTPCYMYDDATISDIEACASAMVAAMQKL